MELLSLVLLVCEGKVLKDSVLKRRQRFKDGVQGGLRLRWAGGDAHLPRQAIVPS